MYSVSTQENVSVGAVNPGSLRDAPGNVNGAMVGNVKSNIVGKLGIVTVGIFGTVMALRVGAVASNTSDPKLGGSGIVAKEAGTVGGLARVNGSMEIVPGLTKVGTS